VIHRGEIPEGTVPDDAYERARMRVRELLDSYQRPAISPDTENELMNVALRVAHSAGLKELPGIERSGDRVGTGRVGAGL